MGSYCKRRNSLTSQHLFNGSHQAASITVNQDSFIRSNNTNNNNNNNQNNNGTERTPLLLNSIGAAAESLMNNSVVGASSIQQGVSWTVAAFLLVNTALGAGMLNYPYAYNQIGGAWAAAFMQVILLVFISSTMFILVYCADFNHDDTYHDVLLSMCGKRAQQISALSIMLTCYGINITFLVIIGDQYDRIFHSLMPAYLAEGDYYWLLDRKFTIFLTSILFIWPMCYAKRLDFLRYASILGMFAMLYVAFLTVYEHFVLDETTIASMIKQHNQQQQTSTTQAEKANLSATTVTNTTTTMSPLQQTNNNTTLNHGNNNMPEAHHQQTDTQHYLWWFEPLAIVPVLCFAYQTHEVIVPVYACMRERCIGSFMKASIFGLIILFFLYNLVGAFGYLTFGANVGADIMSLYDGKDPIVVVGIIALVVKFITTYPPLMFCGRSALDGLYGELRQLNSNEFKQNEKCRRLVISTLWFFSTVALAVFAPDISVTLQLLGSMASINVFVFPGMCLLSLTYRLRRARQALLMGEAPPISSFYNGGGGGGGIGGQNGFIGSHQRAKDFHLISGSGYFGAAMRRQQQRQQMMAAAAAANGCPIHAHQSQNNASPTSANNSNNNNANRYYPTTFATLVEFENNLANLTENGKLDMNSHKHHLPNGTSISHSITNKTTTETHSQQQQQQQQRQQQQQTLTVGGPTTSSSSNSSTGLQVSGSSSLKLQQNGYGSSAATASGLNGQQILERARVRQNEFERMITNGSSSSSMSGEDARRQQQINDGIQHQELSSSGCGGSCCGAAMGSSRPLIGDDCHYDSQYQQQANLQCNCNNVNNGHHQVFNSFSSSFKQFVDASHKLQQLAPTTTGCNSGCDYQKNSPSHLNNYNNHQQQQQQQYHNTLLTGTDKQSAAMNNYYSSSQHMYTNSDGLQQNHCLHSISGNSNNQSIFAGQSVTNSLLNKFGSSIAPSTVAQIGISRCAALGLYLFAGFLIAFGTFIFVLELVSVSGLLSLSG